MFGTDWKEVGSDRTGPENTLESEISGKPKQDLLGSN